MCENGPWYVKQKTRYISDSGKWEYLNNKYSILKYSPLMLKLQVKFTNEAIEF